MSLDPNLSNNLLDFTELKYISDKLSVPDSRRVKKDSLMICTASGSKNHLGKVAYIDEDYGYAFGGFMGMLTPRVGINPKYLFHLMTSDFYKDFIASLSDGANINNLKFDDLKRFPVPVPPLAEQQRIVGILDKAFEGVATAKANTEKNLKNARGLLKSYLKFVFSRRGNGWRQSTIGDQIILQRGFDITKSHQISGRIPVVSSGGIKSFHNKPMARGPGVVIGRKGTLGTVFYLDKDFWPHDTTLWVKHFKENHPKFVYYFLLGLEVKHLNSGTANPALNRNQIHPIEVNWPDISLQAPLVDKFDFLADSVRQLEQTYQKKISALEQLKKSLLYQAFSGQL